MVRDTPMSDRNFRMMSRIHDNPLRRRLSDPSKALRAAGIQAGQRVLEIGPGPGYFTVAAAKMVGEKGRVHALDIHPLAVERVSEKVRRAGLRNVSVTLASASHIPLPAGSVDLAFLFGVAHALDPDLVLPELHRVLVPQGTLAVMIPPWGSRKRFSGKGLFADAGKTRGISRFTRQDVDIQG